MKNLIDGVFTKIMGTRLKKNSYDRFVDYGKNFSPDDDLQMLTGSYKHIIGENKETFELLCKIEEVIMQLRSFNKLEEGIRFYIGGRNSEYIYATAPFYRHETNSKLISDIVGKTEVYGADHQNFLGNEELMHKAYVYLAVKMKSVILANIQNVDNFKQNKFESYRKKF